MKYLSEILANEREHHTISNLAKSLGFKPDTIKIFFENPYKIDALTILADVDYDDYGNANNTFLLAAKLIEKFNIDIIVRKRKVPDRAEQLALENSSFVFGEELKMSQFLLGRTLDKIAFNEPKIDSDDLKEDLELADRTIEKVAKIRAQRAALSTSSTLFASAPQPALSSKTPEPEIEEFLSPENKDAAKETLQELPDDVLLKVLKAFKLKKRTHAEETSPATAIKRPTADKQQPSGNGLPGISVK